MAPEGNRERSELHRLVRISQVTTAREAFPPACLRPRVGGDREGRERSVLQCTPTAAMTLRQLGMKQGFPEHYGVRLFPSETEAGEQAVAIAFAARPAEGDQVDEQHGTRIFVAADVAGSLAHVELDVVPSAAGNGNSSPRLVLRNRSTGGQ